MKASLSLGFLVAFFSITGKASHQLYFKGMTVDPIKASIAEENIWGAVDTNYQIVQFQEKINKDILEGASIIKYVPDNALLIKVKSQSQVQQIVAHKSVRSVTPYKPFYKISPELRSFSIFSQGIVDSYLITTFSQEATQSLVDQLHSLSVDVTFAEGKQIQILGRQSDLIKIASFDGIEYIQKSESMKTMMMDFNIDQNTNKKVNSNAAPSDQEVKPKGDYSDLTGYETGTKIMKFDSAWARGFKGEGQIVAMADTGLDSGDTSTIHQDFKGAVIDGQHYGLYTKSWYDPMGHGTHVAGSVMGRGLASGGVLSGGAYEAHFVAQGMWSDMLKNLSVPPKLATLFSAAYAKGARIHTNSWGNPNSLGNYDGMAVQVDEYMWEHPDFLVLFAAGNSGEDVNKDGRIDDGSVSSPGTAKNALTVGASENLLAVGGIQRKIGELKSGEWAAEPLGSDTLSNDPNGIAMFSSRGPTKDGRLKPDIVAPGTNIVSVCSQVKGASPLWGNYNSDYCYSGGTSMATPLTAGAAAVAREFLVKQVHIADPSAAVVKAILMHTADDLYPGQYGKIGKSKGQEMLTEGPNNQQGYGRVDLDNLTSGPGLVADSQGVSQGGTVDFNVDLKSAGDIKATLVYTDEPGLTSASKALVNDLNLDILDESGNVLASSHSQVNNSEQIVVHGAAAGKYTLRVSAQRVVKGKNGLQPFALIAM